MEKISAVAFIFKLFLLLAGLPLLFPICSDYFFSGEYQDKSEEDSQAKEGPSKTYSEEEQLKEAATLMMTDEEL